MRRLDEIAAEMQTLLADRFRTVRVSSVQAPEQFMRELRAINPEKLPGVIIVFDRFGMMTENTLREDGFTLVVVDRFRAGDDARALSALRAAETLCELFPAAGRRLEGGAMAFPADCTAATCDVDYVCLAVGVTVRQGV